MRWAKSPAGGFKATFDVKPCSDRLFEVGFGFWQPFLVQHAQVQGGAQHRPLRAHVFQSPHRPTSKSIMLFELSKRAFDDLTALLPLLAWRRLLQALAHGLDHGMM